MDNVNAFGLWLHQIGKSPIQDGNLPSTPTKPRLSFLPFLQFFVEKIRREKATVVFVCPV
jgi:hypothetical protein